MATLSRARQNWILYIAFVVLLGALLWLSPAEATLGNVVKLVYAHGAAQRVAMYAYLIAGALGIVHLSLQAFFAKRVTPPQPSPYQEEGAGGVFARWSRALMESAILFWFIQFVVSLPAQMLAWGGISWTEPRVMSALWVLVFTALVYGVAHWVGDARSLWMPVAAIANATIALILLRGAANILHPIDPILGSESIAIKAFYAAIVLTTGALAILFARERVAS
ncbi:MAG: hypothetical protein HY868_12640 [Chloroflexi bacterium]|nr:hypothetical protein [Chloroflexota bacterium]